MHRTLHRYSWLALSTVVLLFTNTLFAQDTSATKSPLRVALDRPADIQNIRLDLDVDIPAKRVAGSATIDLVPLRDLSSLRFDAVGLEVSSVTVADERLSFQSTADSLLVDFPVNRRRGERLKLVVNYQVREPRDGLYFFSPTADEPNVPVQLWSQGQAQGNRHWFPCFDHPNERQSTELVVTVDAGLEVLSNGRLLTREVLAGGKREKFHWRQAEPHVSYLVTLVVGKFATAKDNWRDVPLMYYVPVDRAAEIGPTFSRTKEMVEFFSQRFGIDYPWDKYAQVVVEQFVSGGMENTSATTLTDSCLRDERSVIDGDSDGLISHELGHQWWGDLVTCKEWAHLWLNEGFASYCEVMWDEHRHGKDQMMFNLYGKASGAKAGLAKTRPVVDRHYANPDQMFDSRAYPKGAWILHMLRSQLGDEEFFATLKRYATDYRYQTVETNDLRRAFERQTGRSLERFFYDWTERAGHPEVLVKSEYDPNLKAVKLTIRQTQQADPFVFPLRVEFICVDPNNPSSASSSRSTVAFDQEIRERETVATLNLPSKLDMVRVDPKYSVLMELTEEKTPELWRRQALEAPTVPERLRAIAKLQGDKTPAVREVLGQILASDTFPPIRAQAATELGNIGDQNARDMLLAGLDQKDSKVRASCADALSKFPGDEQVLSTLRTKFEKGDPSLAVEANLLRAVCTVAKAVPVDLCQAAMNRQAVRDTLRFAALEGIGKSKTAGATQILLDTAKSGSSTRVKGQAMRLLGEKARDTSTDEATRQKIFDLLVESINKGTTRVRIDAISALRDLSAYPASFRTAVEKLAKNDPNQRVRRIAQSVLDTKPAASSDKAMAELRAELERLAKTNRELEQRLRRLEGRKE